MSKGIQVANMSETLGAMDGKIHIQPSPDLCGFVRDFWQYSWVYSLFWFHLATNDHKIEPWVSPFILEWNNNRLAWEEIDQDQQR